MANETTSSKKRVIAVAKMVFRFAILALVAVGIWRTVEKAIVDLHNKGFSFDQIQPWWLVAAGGIYLVAMLPCWLFWHRTLLAMGQRPTRLESLRAFYIGHLGKYVPGKALVVILRTTLIRSPRVDTTVAATSVFVETLTMMAVGAAVAAAILGFLFREHAWLTLLAVSLALLAGTPTLPPIFRRLVRLVGVKKFNPQIDQALAGLDFRLMGIGWLTVAAGWCVFGFSLWAVLMSVPTLTPTPLTLHEWPLFTACVALALVAGFLSLLPGGIGIREYVVMSLLSGPLGPGAAAVSAVLLRLVWLLAEVLLAGILYVSKASPSRMVAEPASQQAAK